MVKWLISPTPQKTKITTAVMILRAWQAVRKFFIEHSYSVYTILHVLSQRISLGLIFMAQIGYNPFVALFLLYNFQLYNLITYLLWECLNTVK